jgi:hypothetical protein
MSDDRRIACVLRFLRPDMAATEAVLNYATLVRGTDRFGNFEHAPPPQENFGPEALALYDAIRRDQAKVMMKGAKGDADLYD